MKIGKSLQGRQTKYLNLYPALKQASKEKIVFASANTRAEQLYVRKLLLKRVSHYQDFNAFKTIVLDARYIQKARRNLTHSKSFNNVELHVSEPAVFDLIYKVMRQLGKKSIQNLTVNFEVKENNLSIDQLIKATSLFSRCKVLNLNFDGSKEESCLKVLPVISSMLEKNTFLNNKTNITFRGIFAFLTNHLAALMRYWNKFNSIQVTPSNVYGSLQLPEALEPASSARSVNNLKVTFELLKKFEPEALKKLVGSLGSLEKLRILTLVLNRLELVKERPDILGEFIQNANLERGLKLIIYYVKYQKMNFEKVFNAIEAKGDQLKELVLGHLVIRDEVKTGLLQVLAKLTQLESLKIYWEIKDSLESQQKSNLWEIFNNKNHLEQVEIILTCTSTVLEENNAETQTQNLEKSLKTLLHTLAKLPNLRKLRLVLPEIQVDIGSMVNDMVMESGSLKVLKIEADDYNANYLWELREIQKIKNMTVDVKAGEKDSLKEFETNQHFKLATYFNSYEHFAKIHQEFYLNNV